MKLLDIQFIYVDIAMRSVLFLRSAIFLPSLRLIDLRNAEIIIGGEPEIRLKPLSLQQTGS